MKFNGFLSVSSFCDTSKVFTKLYNAFYCSRRTERRGGVERGDEGVGGGGRDTPASLHNGHDTSASPLQRWFTAIKDHNVPMVTKLLEQEREIHVDMQDQSGWAALHISAWNGYTDLVQMLILHKADINLPGPGGSTPVALASQQGHTQLVSVLISADCDVRKTCVLGDNQEVTPLHLAAQNGHADIVRLLIDAGAKVNAPMMCPDVKGVTPLHLAVQAEHLEVMDILIAAGGDVNSHTQANVDTEC